MASNTSIHVPLLVFLATDFFCMLCRQSEQTPGESRYSMLVTGNGSSHKVNLIKVLALDKDFSKDSTVLTLFRTQYQNV